MKDIKGWEGKYAVTKDGRIWSYVWGGHWLQANTTKKGDWYMSICFGWGKTRKGYKVHRLVAEAFIPNPKHLPEVNHINGDKTDNRVENLEWVSRRENLAKGYITYPMSKRPHQRGEKSWCHKLTEDKVRQIKKRFHSGELSQRKLAKEYGVSHTTIKGIINGWYWAHVH